MSQAKSKPPPPAATPWVTIAIVGLFGILFGATLMFFALRRPSTASTAPSDPATHVPAPGLTAGQPPAEAARTLGNFYYDHQNWPLAIQHYESAIRQGSDDADIRTDLGNAYRFAGRPDDARIQYELAQKMSPSHEFSLFNQGGLYYEELQQPAKAVEIWQEYLRRFPNGRSVNLARQLIAQARISLPAPDMTGAAPVVATPAAPVPGSASEQLILRQIQAARTGEAKP